MARSRKDPEFDAALEERIRAAVPDVGDDELERGRLRVLARSRQSAQGVQGQLREATPMKSRMSLAGILAALLVAVGSVGALAVGGQFSSKENTAKDQYGPGKGCGNPHKTKDRKGECKRKCKADKKNKKKKRCSTKGTSGNDHVRGTRFPDSVSTGDGSDVIDVR